MKESQAKVLLKVSDQQEPREGERRAVLVLMTEGERALLKETAYQRRTSQSAILRQGVRMVALAVGVKCGE